MNPVEFDLVVYVVDTDKSSTEQIKSTVDNLVDFFKVAITIQYDIINVLYDSRTRLNSVCCSHEKPTFVECCYSKPLFLHKHHKNRQRAMDLTIPPSFNEKSNIPYYLSTDYEAVSFTKSEVGADCAFIYPKKQVGTWQLISKLLPNPGRVTGGIAVTSSPLASGSKNSINVFNKRVNTLNTKSLLELSTDANIL